MTSKNVISFQERAPGHTAYMQDVAEAASRAAKREGLMAVFAEGMEPIPVATVLADLSRAVATRAVADLLLRAKEYIVAGEPLDTVRVMVETGAALLETGGFTDHGRTAREGLASLLEADAEYARTWDRRVARAESEYRKLVAQYGEARPRAAMVAHLRGCPAGSACAINGAAERLGIKADEKVTDEALANDRLATELAGHLKALRQAGVAVTVVEVPPSAGHN